MTTSEIKIGMFGGGGVGKTAITLQFVKGEFTEGYVPTIEDSFSKQVQVEGQAVNVEIIDTAGQDDFKEMRFRYYQSCDAFVLVYSIIDKASLENVRELYTDITNARDSGPINCIMAGNKADMRDENSISLTEAQKVADELKCQILETSAKTALNISELYETLIKQTLGIGNAKKQSSSDGSSGGCCEIL